MAIDQVASARGLGGDEVLQSQLADHRQDGLDMAVWERAGDAEGVGGGDEGLALEGAFDDFDEVVGEMGEVAERLVGDGLSLADGPPEQMGDVGLTLVDPFGRSHMNGAASCCHAAIFRRGGRCCQEDFQIFSGYISESKSRLTAYGRVTYVEKWSGTSD